MAGPQHATSPAGALRSRALRVVVRALLAAPHRVRSIAYYDARLRRALRAVAPVGPGWYLVGPPGRRFRMHLAPRDHLAYLLGVYEPDVCAYLVEHLRAGDVAIDVGAHLGYHCLLMAECVGPTGAVVAFEPVDELARRVEANARANGHAQLTVRRAAVSDRVGSTTLRVFDPFSVRSSIDFEPTDEPAELREVDTVSVDAASDALGRPVRLVKVDVEGAEIRAIDGALHALERDGTVLLVELNDAAGAPARAVLAHCAEVGLVVDEVGRRGSDAFVVVRRRPD